jgi:hypothetical protein
MSTFDVGLGHVVNISLSICQWCHETYRAGPFMVRVVDSLEIKSLLGNLAPACLSRSHEVPELVWAVCTSRKLAAHANDGNGLARPLAVIGLHSVEVCLYYLLLLMFLRPNKVEVSEYAKKEGVLAVPGSVELLGCWNCTPL